MSFPRPHAPSPAMAVALVALFVALSGTGYALTIDGTDIRKRSIPGNRIENNALGGRQIDEARLGVVPAAQRAATLAGLAPSAFLPAAGKAADADKLDGQDATAFLGATAKAADADKLDGQDAAAFLGATAKAADSDKLDGQDAAAFLGATAKAADAETLDGVDSSAFHRGQGTLSRSVASLAPGATHMFTTPLSVLRYTCGNPVTGVWSFSYTNSLGGLAPVWVQTGAGMSFNRVGVSAFIVPTPPGGGHLSVGASHQLQPDRTVQAEIYAAADAGSNVCAVYMHVVTN